MITIADFPPTDNELALQNAINLALALAEGSDGANRPLYNTEFTESQILSCPNYLAYTPVLSVLKLEVNNVNGWGNEWREITNYELDSDLGELSIPNITLDYLVSLGFPSAPNKSRIKPKVKIKYISGLEDLSFNGSIKQTLIALTNQLNKLSVSEGIKSFEIDDEGHKTVYASASESAIFSNDSKSSISMLLDTFKTYRPRGDIFA